MVNAARLQEELEFVTRNKAHHEQGHWFQEFPENACKTSGCLAGWTAMHHGRNQLESYQGEVYMDGDFIPAVKYKPLDGEDWADLGARLLDLTYEQAEELFHSANTLWDLWNIANVITRGEIQIPEEVEAMRNDRYNQTEDEDLDFLLED